MQLIAAGDKIVKRNENVIFRCQSDPLQCQTTAVKEVKGSKTMSTTIEKSSARSLKPDSPVHERLSKTA